MPHLEQIRGIGQFFACDDATRGRGKRDETDGEVSVLVLSWSMSGGALTRIVPPPSGEGLEREPNPTRELTPKPPASDATFRNALCVVLEDEAALRRVPWPDRKPKRRERDLEFFVQRGILKTTI